MQRTEKVMNKDKTLRLALEALETELAVDMTNGAKVGEAAELMCEAITAIKQALALDKKAENARELGLDYEPVQEPSCKDCYIDKPCSAKGKDFDVCSFYVPPPAEAPVARHYVDGGHLVYPAAQRQRVLFPTMLRKMWSGSEVQAWLDENVNKENT